ncbi:MAG: 4'-phosphopantetheinyl transferase family protein [Candidatus Geothermincolia bacterium]
MAFEVDVYLVNIDAVAGPPAAGAALLSASEKERAAGFRFDRDRDRYVTMHAALRYVLSACTGAGAAAIEFRYNDYDRPRVPGGPEFNISYSGDRGLIAVTGVPVGVDIEMVDREKSTPEMIDEVFSSSERELNFGDDSLDTADAFFRGWVRKESVIKAVGTGVSFPLKLVDSRLDSKSFTAEYSGAEWWTCDLDVCGPGYRAALTVALKDSPPAIKFKEYEPAE